MYNARMNLFLVALLLLSTMCTIQEAHIIPVNESVIQEEHIISADQNAVQEKHANPENESTTHDEKVIPRSGTIFKRIFRVFSKDPKKRYQGAQRLCSSKLSDALSVVCYGRGYNSPFSGNVETRRNGDPGIVEECCHEGCNYQQLERYCNPVKEVQDEEDEDYGHNESEETGFPDVPILNNRPRRMKSVTRCKNSAKSVTPRNMPGQNTETDNSNCITIRKIDLKMQRHRGKGDRNIECKGKADARKRHRGRHCRCRRRRLKCRQAGKNWRRIPHKIKSLLKLVTPSPTNKFTS